MGLRQNQGLKGANRNMTKRARKAYRKKPKSSKARKKRERNAKFSQAKTKSKKTIAKLLKRRKNQTKDLGKISKNLGKMSINNKKHDIMMMNVGSTSKLKVKE